MDRDWLTSKSPSIVLLTKQQIGWEIALAYSLIQDPIAKDMSPVIDLTVLQQNYVSLHLYLGDVAFRSLSKAFFAGKTPSQKTVRWYCNMLPEFLATYKPFARCPEIQELAALELALNRAFDAPDILSLTSNTFLDSTTALPLKLHPSVQSLRFLQNTTSIWSALKCGEQPPKPHKLDQTQSVIAWRQDQSARFRILGEDEALALAAPTTSPNNPYFRGWLEAELLLPPARGDDILEK